MLVSGMQSAVLSSGRLSSLNTSERKNSYLSTGSANTSRQE